MGLTEEQRARIERNRQEALAKRARLQQQQHQQPQQQPQQPPPQQPPPQQQQAPAYLHAAQRSTTGPRGQAAQPHRSFQAQQQQQRPAAAQPTPDVPVVMVDAFEAAIIEQAMMAAAARRPAAQPQQPQASSQGNSQWQQQQLSMGASGHLQQSQPAHRPQQQQQQQQQQKASTSQQPALQSPPAAATGPPVTVNLAVTADGMFKAMCGYHAGVIGVFKTIKSRSYDTTSRIWSFQVREHDELVQKLTGVCWLLSTRCRQTPITTLSLLSYVCVCARVYT